MMDRRSIARAAMSMSMSSSNIKNSSAAAMRKGPWTEEEDEQLVRFVRLFGERRWDFLAKVSGLRRTGKSCRLRWVNYLHPGLRRGRITADEERLILQLHAQYGSRWSRIARSLPGRTDNEIKNFWRTRTRKHRAQQQQEEIKRRTGSGSDGDGDTPVAAAAAASSPSSFSGTATSDDCCTAGSPNSAGVTATSASPAPLVDDEAELEEATAASQQPPQEYYCGYTAMDQLWNEIAAADAAAMAGYAYAVDSWGACSEPSMPASPVWDFCADYPLWKIDDEEYYKKMLDAS